MGYFNFVSFVFFAVQKILFFRSETFFLWECEIEYPKSIINTRYTDGYYDTNKLVLVKEYSIAYHYSSRYWE